jgi:predicted secreted protein
MAKNGASYLILVNTGTPGTPTWTAVGSQRDATITEERDLIDASSKDSDKQASLGGRYRVNLELQAVYLSGDAAYAALETAHRDGDQVQVVYSEDASNVERIDGYITSLQRSFPDQEVALADVSIGSDGDWQAA